MSMMSGLLWEAEEGRSNAPPWACWVSPSVLETEVTRTNSVLYWACSHASFQYRFHGFDESWWILFQPVCVWNVFFLPILGKITAVIRWIIFHLVCFLRLRCARQTSTRIFSGRFSLVLILAPTFLLCCRFIILWLVFFRGIGFINGFMRSNPLWQVPQYIRQLSFVFWLEIIVKRWTSVFVFVVALSVAVASQQLT